MDELLVFADNLAEDCLKQARVTNFERLKSIGENDFKNINLKHPFNGISAAGGFWDYQIPMIDGEHVTDDSGTGFVHTAPSHGSDDYEAFVKLVGCSEVHVYPKSCGVPVVPQLYWIFHSCSNHQNKV